ncbi:ABC transporter permease [Bryobacter aggregatus]|uniref:ABC transporter permease n=1 Tax=Bryobacter aggregatus TaxID=360054 RepID=UPI001EE35C40|nr:ABC transporter permease [Bryobacter aggregatus]
MAWLDRWRNVFRAESLNREIEDELQYHLAETVDRLVAEGMSEQNAWRAARLRLGNYSAQKERTRDMNIATWLDATRADFLYGIRQLRLDPGFATIAILSLALGIGGNTAIFQLIDAVCLKNLPVQNPEELVAVDFEKGSSRPGVWYGRSAAVSSQQWELIRDQQRVFRSVAAWSPDRFNLADGGEPRMAEGLYVSGDFFEVLGVNALLGRTLTVKDDSAACNPGMVLSYAFWQREFAGDPGVLQRSIRLGGRAIPILGVMPAAFFGVQVGNQFDLALPLCADRLLANDQQGRARIPFSWWLSILGRLKPGETVASASAQLRTLSPGIMQSSLPPAYQPDTAKRFLQNKMFAVEGGSGFSRLRDDYERPLWLLMAITGLVLLIACANLANLLLARASVREREIAIRLAIGASRSRLVRQLLVESLLVALAGSALGMLLAVSLSGALVAFLSTADNSLFVDLTLDWRILGFTTVLGVLTCLLVGLLPAWRATHRAPVAAMQAAGRSVTAGNRQSSLRRMLVITQVSLSFVLLFGSLLFVRSLQNLLHIDSGFQADGLLTVNLDFSSVSYPKERRLALWREMQDRLSVIPGVVSLAQASITPLSGSSWDGVVGGDATPASGSTKSAFFTEVGPGYFQTMGTPLLAGREFNDRDTSTSPKVAIVDEIFARNIFGGANPIGRSFHMTADRGKPEPVYEVVGLVRRSKYGELRENFKPLAYFAIVQTNNLDPSATFVLRTAGPPVQVMDGVKATIAALGPSIGINFHPLSVQLQNSLLRDRLMATLSAGFGFLAVLLATLGLYGVISYMVAQRRNEIGIRIALGADRSNVIRLILREALFLLGCGLAMGNILALFAGKAAATLLFGLEPHDVVSLMAASLLLALIALLASYLPAKKAADGNPMAALRNE